MAKNQQKLLVMTSEWNFKIKTEQIQGFIADVIISNLPHTTIIQFYFHELTDNFYD